MRIVAVLAAIGIGLLVAPPLATAAGPLPAAGSAVPATPRSAAGSVPVVATSPADAARPAPAKYRNPLKLALGDGQDAQSCADPMVIHGQQPQDKNWYLYCTSDALTAAPGPDGKPVIHNLPMYRSTDLVDWSYVGDALPSRPAWVAPTGGMWAPDVTFRGGVYYLYYAASQTTLPGGGSAVGVATSVHPTGPWTDSGQPVVEPQQVAAGVNPRWEFDPEVITAGTHSYIYFGSYFGGVHARELTADGLHSVASTETAIAIDNRYEGTTIVRHDGWYYFMGSATNCCNGPLTGYSVFAARSRSPLGPFVDRDGRSILVGRVGGTPVITQNGNRWVGTGHNTVITDFAGQDWTIYHAVDRNHPYYTGDIGYTKRPSLIDPLDWRNGWPVVRGDRGPSDELQPGPVAQPGERSTYSPHFVSIAQPGQLISRLSDSFSGSTLSAQWTQTVPTAAGPTVSAGSLHWNTQAGDLHPESPTTPVASVLTEPAPAGDYLVETRISNNVPAEGCCQNFVQSGLVIYADNGNYIKLSVTSIYNTRQTEFGREVTATYPGYPHYGNGVDGPVGDWTYLRVEHHRLGGADVYTAYTSLDGRRWDKGGTWTSKLGTHPKIGLISMGGARFTSTFDYVRVSTVRPACSYE